ncbi:hypothetical protein HBB16_03405 [Pseudonocardia sp. MCCB 268]|nr:hypothetical protein [Pseudonocardia cytotoxica]
MATFVGLVARVAYATVRAFMQEYYYVAESTATDAVLLAVRVHRLRRGPHAAVSPAVPALFRLTCYYHRKAHYRAFGCHPRSARRSSRTPATIGETRFR